MSFKLNRGLEPLTTVKTFKYATWDIEATDWWNLSVVGLWDGERYFHFKTIPEFLDYALQTRFNNWRFFAHFGGRYDFNFVFDYLRTQVQKKIAVSFYCSGSLVIKMSIRYRNITIHLCDSFRLFYMPVSNTVANTSNKAGLRDLGIAFNVEHKKSDIDWQDIGYNIETIQYNEQDCRCLYEVIERFFEETGIFSETFATHALRVWRKDFLKDIIWKPPDNVLEFIRRGYHGGRVEIFKQRSSHLYAYDVNSMYPYVMQSPQPVHYIGSTKKFSDTRYGFVECTVYFPEFYIPTLPLHMEKLYFPCGTFRGVWSTEELHEAEKRGARIQKVHVGHYFTTLEIFSEYVAKLYHLKKTSGEPTRTIAKGLLNALYGKFGQNPVKKIYTTEVNAPNGSFPILDPNGIPSGFAYHERTSHSAYLLPHLASSVTSKARLHLLTKLDSTSYYCDTDSVFTDQQITTSKELGDWGIVGEGEAYFVQPKLYKWRGTWKSKGLNKEQSIDDFIAGSPNTIKRARSIKEALRDGGPACAHIVTEKYLRETRPKRAWDGNNGDTRPWNVSELEKGKHNVLPNV